jgi:hypothetical protein
MLPRMTYSTAEARRTLLDAVAEAADDVALALAYLGEAYELLDEFTADRLEEQLFRPAQRAYGRVQSAHGEFAARHGLPARAFERPSPRIATGGARGTIDSAVDALAAADARLSDLQDSMLPVEVGDAPLRAGLSEVRTLVSALPARAREIERTLGR